MKRPLTLIALASALVATVGTAQAANHIDNRQERQEHRISQGVANGSLTPRETARLEHQQQRIERVEERDRADGGGLNRRERAHIAHMQNRASRNIARQKHDRQRTR